MCSFAARLVSNTIYKDSELNYGVSVYDHKFFCKNNIQSNLSTKVGHGELQK